MDDIRQDIKEIKKDLKEHMRRTDLLEKRQDKLHSVLKPIEVHVAVRSGVEKALLALLAASATIVTIWKAFH